LVVGADVTWLSAFLFKRGGQRIAIVGRYDVPTIIRADVFQEVIGYDEGVRQPLLEVLRRLDPQQIGLNYSPDDPTADGLTHVMWLQLNELLRDTPYPSRFSTAAPLLSRLRARKSPIEIERVRAAIRTTEAVVEQLGKQIRSGVSEVQLADFVHEQFRAH